MHSSIHASIHLPTHARTHTHTHTHTPGIRTGLCSTPIRLKANSPITLTRSGTLDCATSTSLTKSTPQDGSDKRCIPKNTRMRRTSPLATVPFFSPNTRLIATVHGRDFSPSCHYHSGGRPLAGPTKVYSWDPHCPLPSTVSCWAAPCPMWSCGSAPRSMS